MLKAALDKLWGTRRHFCLNIFFTPTQLSPYMHPHSRYSHSELERIFDNTDLVVIPSLWQETFGYGVLEALSYGVPILTGNHTGACDIVEPGAGIILENINVENLYTALSAITAEQLSDMNEIICKKQRIPTMRDVAKLLEEKCYH